LLAPDREAAFLRRVREALFLRAQNIARSEVLAECAAAEGVDAAQFALLLHSGIAERAFERDLEDVRSLGVRGFPTLIVSAADGQRLTVHGAQSYARLEQLLLRVTGFAPADRVVSPREALAAYGTGTTREFAELLGLDQATTRKLLQESGARRTSIAGDVLWSAGHDGPFANAPVGGPRQTRTVSNAARE
jgi:predicted DsbA family dithiol-disulfide isomerase